MSAAHTPGLLVQDMRGYPHADVKAVSGRKVACTWGINSSTAKSKAAYDARTAEGRSNARRIVACWNACDGVDTETLENNPAPFSALRTERDELLDSLIYLRNCIEDGTTPAMREVNAAIAKATGGGV